MGLFAEKVKEVLSSVLPITLFVIILHFIATPLSGVMIGQFLIGAFLVVVGLAIFLVGVDLGATPIGEHAGERLVHTGKMSCLMAGGLGLGFLISIAEPDLQILATEVAELTGGAIGKFAMVIVVSVGVGLLVMTGFWRIVRSVKLRTVLWVAYFIILILAIFNDPVFHNFAFDASGATTGAITTPFILALAAGVSKIKVGQSEDARDQFGLVGLASAGAILAVLSQGTLVSVPADASLAAGDATTVTDSLFAPYLAYALPTMRDALFCVAPLAIVFVIMQLKVLKLRRHDSAPIFFGLFCCWLGLAVFTIGVMGGFMETGRIIGSMLIDKGQPWMTILAGLFLGMLTVIAEPAVLVLTESIEKVTDGIIPRKVVLAFLAAGVGISVALAVVRIYIEDLLLWHILLPAYILIMIMSFFTPELYLGIAFDAGGVASGPMTATFVLAFTQGAARGVPYADMLIDGFGVIALVAMAPLITLQILGIISVIQKKRQTSVQDVLLEPAHIAVTSGDSLASTPANDHTIAESLDEPDPASPTGDCILVKTFADSASANPAGDHVLAESSNDPIPVNQADGHIFANPTTESIVPSREVTPSLEKEGDDVL